jgi:hypothetical protein
MIAHKGYGKAADYWSLGCICYEMLSGRTPFHSKLGEKDILRKILSERIKMPQGITSHACKVVKGLLNRNPQDRLGAAKSTMFHIGGVTGLKQMEFFQAINWSKLERKEMEPPTRFMVDNDTDVKHFHEEFIKMDIPPSVIHMTQDHFQPRRCDSQHFRGFSFIQEEFELPDRNVEEMEKYWNNVDHDGESASTVDILSEDQTTFGTGNGHPKKKRPPRKKNKTKGVVGIESITAIDNKNMNGSIEDKVEITPSPHQEQMEQHEKNNQCELVSDRKAEEAIEGDIETEFSPIVEDFSGTNQMALTDDTPSLHLANTTITTQLDNVLQPTPTAEPFHNCPATAAVYVPPSLRMKKEQQQSQSKNSFKLAPMYMNSSRRTIEQYSSLAATQHETTKVALPQSTMINKSNDSTTTKPFPGSWATKTSSSSSSSAREKVTTADCYIPILGVDNSRSMQNNSTSESKAMNIIPPSVVKKSGIKSTGIMETEQAMKNLSIGKEEKEVITTMDWPSLGAKTTPKTNDISKPAPAINNGVWGSKNKLSISTSSAWNHKNTNNSKDR